MLIFVETFLMDEQSFVIPNEEGRIEWIFNRKAIEMIRFGRDEQGPAAAVFIGGESIRLTGKGYDTLIQYLWGNGLDMEKAESQ